MAKQLHDLLDTKKKTEQVERVEQLLQAARTPVFAVMVVMDPRSQRIDIRAAGVENASTQDIKFVLRQAIDNLTVQEAQAQQQPAEPVDIPVKFEDEDGNPVDPPEDAPVTVDMSPVGGGESDDFNPT